MSHSSEGRRQNVECRMQSAETREATQSHPKATSMRHQSHPEAKAECRMQNAERRGKAAQSQVRARYKPGTSQVQAKCKPGAWEVHAWYMRGTCMVHAWYKPPRTHPEAKGAGGEPPCCRFAPVGISVALQRLVPVPAGMRSTVCHFFPAKARTRGKASLPSEIAPGGGTLEPLKRLPRAPALY